MELRDFRQVSGDAPERAGAFAMAGVLTAASHRFPDFALSDVHWLVNEIDQGHLEWVIPDFAVLEALGVSDPDACESLWRESFLSVEQLNYRLMIRQEALTGEGSAPALQDWIEMFSGLGPHDNAGIGAICLTVPTKCLEQHWQWPLRVALSDADRWAVENSMGGMFDRGLAIAVAHSYKSDLTYKTADKLNSDISDSALVVALTNGSGDWISHVQSLSERVTATNRPVALVDLDGKDMPLLADLTVHEIAHDYPLDIALNTAERIVGGTLERMPTVIIAPESGYLGMMESGRISRHYDRVLRLLEGEDPTQPLPEYEPGMFAPFPIRHDPRTIGGLRAALRRAIANPEDAFDREGGGATSLIGIKKLAHSTLPKTMMGGGQVGARPQIDDEELEALVDEDVRELRSEYDFEESFRDLGGSHDDGEEEAAGTRGDPPLEAERFVDVALYPDHLFQDPDPAMQVKEDQGLDPYSPYTLEVAIRSKRIGITAGDAPRPVLNPRRDTSAQTIWVRIDTPTPELFEFDSKLRRISWPHDADSTSAVIHLTTREASMGREGKIEIRLLSDGLDLLELIELEGIQIGEPGALELTYPAGRPSALDPKLIDAERHLNLRIGGATNGYTLDAIWRRDGTAPTGMALDRTILIDDLAALNADLRAYWAKAALGVLENRDRVSDNSLKRMLEDVTMLGERAWRVLFGGNSADHGDTAAALAGLLAQADTGPDQLIQITQGSGAQGFVFPWAILRPPRKRGEAADWGAFWGLRHRVERVVGGRRPDGLNSAPVCVATAQDPNFEQTAPHFQSLSAMAADLGVDLDPPFASVEALKSSLMSAAPPHLYYFFCHGYAPSPALLPRDVEKAFRSAADASLHGLGERPDMAAISFGGGRISEHELAALPDFENPRPVFFLNMCQSAEAAPGRSDGLMLRLLERGASAVIGTECEMTAAFASRFGEEVLHAAFTGADLGEAVLAARRSFQADGNPLGLAYSLYGRAETKLGPPELPNSFETTGEQNEH